MIWHFLFATTLTSALYLGPTRSLGWFIAAVLVLLGAAILSLRAYIQQCDKDKEHELMTSKIERIKHVAELFPDDTAADWHNALRVINFILGQEE